MKFLYLALIATLFTACNTPTDDAITEEKFATKEQSLVTCRSDCPPPTYNGLPVSCTANAHCMSDPGAVYCLNGSTWSTTYCQQPYCGDGMCNGTEDWQTCGDCPQPSSCGNGVCERWLGEGGWNCQDCCQYAFVPCEIEP